MTVVVQLLRIPGTARALVSAEVAALGVQLGEMRLLDRPDDDQPPPAMRVPRQINRVR